MKKRSVRVGSAVAIFVVALLFTSVLCCFAVCKLYRHEQRQNAEIQFLSQEINRLKSEITPPRTATGVQTDIITLLLATALPCMVMQSTGGTMTAEWQLLQMKRIMYIW